MELLEFKDLFLATIIDIKVRNMDTTSGKNIDITYNRHIQNNISFELGIDKD